MEFIVRKTAKPNNGIAKLNDKRSIISKSSFLGYKAAIKEYPGRKSMSKIPRIVLIIVPLYFGVKIKTKHRAVANNISIRSNDMNFLFEFSCPSGLSLI